jgi:hypothetical protein
VLYRIVNPSTRNGLADYGDWYVAGNYVHAYPSATADNWTYGVQGPSAAEKDSIRSDVPFAHISINEETAENAYQSVLANVGANLPKRDSVDLRVLGNVAAGDATYEGPTYRVVQNLPTSTPITGIIDTQSDVGGWPTLNSTEPPLDTDHDGMPDAWESARGLSVSDPSDRNIVGPEGYTNLELYLNGPELIAGVEESHQPTGYELFPVFPNPFNPSTNVSFTVGQDRWASVRVYNLIGQIVGTPFEGMAQANQRYRFQFDASRLPSGVYLAVLESVGIRQCQRMLLMK